MTATAAASGPAPGVFPPSRTPKVEVNGEPGLWRAACKVPECPAWFANRPTRREAADDALVHRTQHRRLADEAQAALELEQRQRVLAFRVDGIPRQQGSLKPKGTRRNKKTGKTFTQLGSDNEAELYPWRSRVAEEAAKAARAQGWERADYPVRVWAEFTRPAGGQGGRPVDVDKLQRALGDGISDAGVVWIDDKKARGWVADCVTGDYPGVLVVITHHEAFEPQAPHTVSLAFDSLLRPAAAVLA